MSLAHHSLVAWQRADDRFIPLHQLSFKLSHASLAEVGYCIHVARRLGSITEAAANELEIQVKEVGAPLAGLIRSARLKLAAATGAALILIGSLILRLA